MTVFLFVLIQMRVMAPFTDMVWGLMEYYAERESRSSLSAPESGWFSKISAGNILLELKRKFEHKLNLKRQHNSLAEGLARVSYQFKYFGCRIAEEKLSKNKNFLIASASKSRLTGPAF